MKYPSWVNPVTKRTLEVTLPLVLSAIRRHIEAGGRPVQLEFWRIPGYKSIRNHYPFQKIVDMATGKVAIGLPEALR